MRVSERPTDGYIRLVVPLDNQGTVRGDLRFSCELSKDPECSAVLQLEIFLATLDGTKTTRVQTLRKNIKTKYRARINTGRLDTSLFTVKNNAPTTRLALVMEFIGLGAIKIHSPCISPHVATVIPTLQASGQFEDPNIREQVKHLRLSPIWNEKVMVSTSVVRAREPLPYRPNPLPRSNAGLPFTQIIVPVLNAAADVNALFNP